MKAALFIYAFSLAASGCHNPLESDPPYIRGVITVRDLGVWITGATLGPYPTQVGATRIIIEKQQ